MIKLKTIKYIMNLICYLIFKQLDLGIGPSYESSDLFQQFFL